MEIEHKKKDVPQILIVDDINVNVEILENIIQSEGYEALCALSVEEALDIMSKTMPQLILSDFSMPDINGVEFCKILKSNPRTREIPFIFITVLDSREEKREAFLAGAVDFIPKPFEPVEVIMRVNNQLNSYRIKQEMEEYNRLMHNMVAEQKRQMEKEQENMLLALAKVVEKKDMSMKNHIEKVGYNSRVLAQSLQLISQYENHITDRFVETIETAAKLHDIGNIAMPDEMFYAGERTVIDAKKAVQRHTEEGVKILEGISEINQENRFLEMAISIAKYHHAKWDGTGYPENVKGKEIPLEARITAITNDFDRMRVKEGLSLEESQKRITEGSGSFYEPCIVEVFNKVLKQLKVD